MGGLVLVQGGMLGVLEALRASWLPSLRMGLFANDIWPQKIDNVGRYQPATFPGYDGLHSLSGWGAAALDGDIAVTNGFERTWTHNGAPGGGWVIGYYVVDAIGVLQWAERPAEEGVPMVYAGQSYKVTPQFAMGSRYPG